MTKITKHHYISLFLRSSIFIFAIIAYIIDKLNDNNILTNISNHIIWIFFISEMILRLFPSKNNSMGNQKIFKKNFIPTNVNKQKREYKTAIIVAIIWILVNSIFISLYGFKIIDKGFITLICLFYSVCDLLCILLVCPFQKLIMKNRCCNTCRIYNWDYIMMFLPFICIPDFFSYSLFILSLIVLIVWEITYFKYPERFHNETNENIKCKNCKELMCKNKLRLVKDEIK